jgi:hypothetical protein
MHKYNFKLISICFFTSNKWQKQLAEPLILGILYGFSRRGRNPMATHHSIDRDAELEPATAPDRRRLGRREDVSPMLIPLLRDDFSARLRNHLIDEEPDQLRSFRGIILWVPVSAALWVLLLWCFL